MDAVELGRQVRRRRLQADLGQAELAAAAGVSRQALGALEAGRHLPRVDAAVRLARALGTSVEELADPAPAGVERWDGRALRDGMVRVARVRDRQVVVPIDQAAGELFTAPDGVVSGARLELLPGASPRSLLVAGCDPALGVLAEATTGRATTRIVPVLTSTSQALTALQEGRVHAAVVHAPEPTPQRAQEPVRRTGFARWRTGVAVPDGSDLTAALDGREPMIVREPGAAAQAALERVTPRPRAAGAPARSHLEAARRAVLQGVPAVTIEPAARSLGLAFHPLETHGVELWVPDDLADHPGVSVLGELLAGAWLRSRLRALPAYEVAA